MQKKQNGFVRFLNCFLPQNTSFDEYFRGLDHIVLILSVLCGCPEATRSKVSANCLARVLDQGGINTNGRIFLNVEIFRTLG